MRLPACPHHTESGFPLTGKARERTSEEEAFWDSSLLPHAVTATLVSSSLSPAPIQHINEAVSLRVRSVRESVGIFLSSGTFYRHRYTDVAQNSEEVTELL